MDVPSSAPGRSALEDWLRRGMPLPEAAAHGRRTYFADLHAPRGERHVRVCAGTACFVAGGGGGHLPEVEAALGVAAGTCAPDGSVSLQEVHCLGYCYGGPAALDGDRPRAGADLADQLAGRAEPRDPPAPIRAAAEPVVLGGALGAEAAWQVWPAVLAEGGAERVRREVALSGLRGRGGAGFPAAHKWDAVVAARDGADGQRYVVANGDEGDPGSFADRLLMERDPGRVLEGLALAGLACDATRGYVYVRSEYPRARAAMQAAVARARATGHLGHDVHDSGVAFDVEVASGHGSYVAGEETSLLRSLAGLRGTARARPPYPTQRGLLGRPTGVNNVETLAAVPAIVAAGGAAYARRGTPAEPGTLIVSLSEGFARPGAYEVEFGTPLRSLVKEFGGGLHDGAPLRALQVGGPLGGFLGPAALDRPLAEAALAPTGVSLGHGSLVAVDDRVSRDDLLQHLWRFGARESCGACTPCREGTRLGTADPADSSRDEGLLGLMERASLCAFGRRLPVAVRTLLAVPAWS
jgi:NADH:ubiquinone oxidoreductase subunit F (NADH-binding)